MKGRIASSVTGTNARLLFLNETLYPESTASDAAGVLCAGGIGLTQPH